MPLLRRIWTSDTCVMFVLVEFWNIRVSLPSHQDCRSIGLEEDVLPLACCRDLLLLGFRPWWSPLAANLAGWGGQVMSPISILRIARPIFLNILRTIAVLNLHRPIEELSGHIVMSEPRVHDPNSGLRVG